MMMTSAYANKLLKSLEEEKTYWRDYEDSSSTYVASLEEEPVIPEYDFVKISQTLAEIDEKICTIKHALNVSNATAKVPVGDQMMSVDVILVKMAQLNRRKMTLDSMRKRLPKTRAGRDIFASRSNAVEYTYINYDLDLVKAEYESVSKAILDMQMALDKYNQTEQFEVNI